jgi:hypothetical protein
MLSNQKFLAVFLATLILFGVTSTAAETQKSNIIIAKLVNLDTLDEVTANSAAIETLSTKSQNLIKRPKSINNYSKCINNDHNVTDIILNVYQAEDYIKTQFYSYNFTNIKASPESQTNLEEGGSEVENISAEINDIGPDDNLVLIKFKEIQSIPYDEKSMNCRVKSELFADYLLENGGKEIYLVKIQHDSGEYCHEFVEWNGRYYDPTSTGLSYLSSEEAYMEKLHKLGFNGLTIKSPYITKMV